MTDIGGLLVAAAPSEGQLAKQAAEPSRPTRILTANEASIREAATIIRAGGLVAMPTETVYGLAADASNERAVAALYAAKGRPQFNPLIAHVASLGGRRARSCLKELRAGSPKNSGRDR